MEYDFEYMCFLVVGNVDTDIVGLRQQNIRLFEEFYLRVNVVPPLNQQPSR